MKPEVATLAGTPASESMGYTASVAPSLAAELDLWSRMADQGAALPFQRGPWLEAWAATKGRNPGLDLLPVTIRASDGTPVMALPLVRERQKLRVIGFADGGLADYNAPILAPMAPQDAHGAANLWRALLRALPGADLVRFERMPPRVGPLLNPLALLPSARPSTAGGFVVDMSGGYPGWRQARPRRYRMELGRCARLFDTLPGARFERVAGAGQPMLEVLERLQRDRITRRGQTYLLDEADTRDFYRMLAADLNVGPGTLTALIASDEVVAALFGLREGARFTMLRLGASDAFARLSPGRHLIARTMEALSAEGVRTFDYGLGDYAYKRKLGAMPVALCDLVAARTPLGLAHAAALRFKTGVRAMPRLHAMAARTAELWRGSKA